MLLFIGILLALSQGIPLRLAMAAITGVTFWELARLTGWHHPELHAGPLGRYRPLFLAILAGLSLFGALMWMNSLAPLLLFVPILAGLPGAARHERLTFVIFGLAILAVGYVLVGLREAFGLPFIMWLIGIVIASDVMGYFVGKMVGGPKFWPSLSPKKTWSGTIAGWVGAVIVGALVWLTGHGDASLLWISPLVAFAGQLGDIAESWLKRRAGVKDSSDLIPGHGGFMDRFDAVCGATLGVMIISIFLALPEIV